MSDPLSHVDVLDLIDIQVIQSSIMNKPGALEVQLVPIDQTKNVVMDEDANKVLNERITERTADMKIADPRTVPYIREFVGRMISELYRNGLLILEDVDKSEWTEDHYGDLRKKYARNIRNN